MEYWSLKMVLYDNVCAGELAFDGACVAVRVAAVAGLAALAQNPLTQPLMKVMLPTLRPLMWDSALAVRIALADMLLAIGWVAGTIFSRISSAYQDVNLML